MTSVVRYVTNNTGVAITVGSTGGDYQLVAYDITLGAQIAANANANILQYTGPGKIKSILLYLVKAAGSVRSPAPALQDVVTIDATGKIINVAVANGGVAIAQNSLVSLLLVIGNY